MRLEPIKHCVQSRTEQCVTQDAQRVEFVGDNDICTGVVAGLLDKSDHFGMRTIGIGIIALRRRFFAPNRETGCVTRMAPYKTYLATFRPPWLTRLDWHNHNSNCD
jgi:hypothetical protein